MSTQERPGGQSAANVGRASLAAAFVALAALSAPPAGRAETLAASETDARKIATAVENRDDGNKMISKVSFVVTDAKGRKTSKSVETRRLNEQGKKLSLMMFLEPADMRNVGLLSVDYDDHERDDDQWLYLPSLHRATRVSASERSSAFLGTDLTFSDVTRRATKRYDYKLAAASETVDGEDCWVIDAAPSTAKERDETGYEKFRTWISKRLLMPVRSKIWLNGGRKIKYVQWSDFKSVDGVWIAKRMQVRIVQGKEVQSETVMTVESVRLNDKSVVPDQFTQSRLERGV